ncbi:MAG: ATP-binding protein [Spirochaetota bacterium]
MRKEFGELLERSDLTEEEFRAIPARANINNQAVYEFFCRRHGVPLERILAGTNTTANDFLDEKLWTDPLSARTHDLNAAASFPGFFHHRDAFREGQAFVDVLPNLHIIYFRLLPIRTILSQLQRANAKFNHEYRLEGFSIKSGFAQVRLTPYPYRLSILVGQECNFVRGVLQANFTLHGIRDSDVTERYCSTPLRRLVEGLYGRFGLSYREDEGRVYLDDVEVARRISLIPQEVDGRTVYRPASSFTTSSTTSSTTHAETAAETALQITRDYTHNGHLLFRKGEIYDAPHCLFDLNWRPRSPLAAAIGQIRTARTLRGVTRLEMNRHIEHSNRTFFELLEQKQLTIDALQSADRRKDAFLSTTAHDLRTPLNGIIGLLESAEPYLNGADPARARRYIELSLISARRLAHLVNDILDFSRLRDGAMTLTIGEIDLLGILVTTIETVRPLARGKPLEIELLRPGSPRCEMRGDENRLSQVFFNLLANAIKFTHAGRIEVSCRRRDSMVEVTVSDTGIGIPPDKLSAIFESYEQVSAERASVYGGAGIGLVVVKRIVELHGGTVEVESVEGEGSTFTVRLPTAGARLPAAAKDFQGKAEQGSELVPAIAPAEAASRPAGGGPGVQSVPAVRVQPLRNGAEIWICDDDAINREVLESILDGEGYAVRSFARGEGVLQALDDGQPPGAVLLDVMMPGIGGLETCRRIRGCYPISELPVIMVTARTFSEDLVAGLNAGASDYVTKPVIRRELLARTHLHLSLARAFTAQQLHHNRLRLLDTLLAVIGLSRGASPGEGGAAEGPGSTKSRGEDGHPQDVAERVNAIMERLSDPAKADGEGKDLRVSAAALAAEHARLVEDLISRSGIQSVTEEFAVVLEKLFSILNASPYATVAVNADRLGLSAREAEVVEQVCLGYGNQEIAATLEISENTVKRHLYNAFNKLGVDTRGQLIYKVLAIHS